MLINFNFEVCVKEPADERNRNNLVNILYKYFYIYMYVYVYKHV